MGIKFRVTGSQAGRTRPRAIGVLALAKAKAGAEDRLNTEALGLVAPSRAEPGNISYDLHQGTEDTTTFVFYENWKSMEAFDSHKKSTHIQGFLTATKDLLDGALKVTLLNEISEPSEPERYKVARTRVPKTAEFKPYRDAKADQTKSDLMDAAAVAISRVAETHPERVKAGLRPDDLYETVMGEQGLSKSWEAAFGGEESGRQMFGLVAWTYFFNHSGHWLGTPSNRAGLGKRGWTYVAEPEPEKPAGAPVVPSPRRSGRRITMETTIAAAAVAPRRQSPSTSSGCIRWFSSEARVESSARSPTKSLACPTRNPIETPTIRDMRYRCQSGLAQISASGSSSVTSRRKSSDPFL